MKVWIDNLSFGQALTALRKMNEETDLDVFGIRLPKWKEDWSVRVKYTKGENPYLCQQGNFGDMKWSPSQSELFDNTWEVVEVEE